jgi:hypothetical protein
LSATFEKTPFELCDEACEASWGRGEELEFIFDIPLRYECGEICTARMAKKSSLPLLLGRDLEFPEKEFPYLWEG